MNMLQSKPTISTYWTSLIHLKQKQRAKIAMALRWTQYKWNRLPHCEQHSYTSCTQGSNQILQSCEQFAVAGQIQKYFNIFYKLYNNLGWRLCVNTKSFFKNKQKKILWNILNSGRFRILWPHINGDSLLTVWTSSATAIHYSSIVS